MSRISVSAGEGFRALSNEKAELIDLLLAERRKQTNRILPCPRVKDSSARVRVPASWAQLRLWFIDQLEGGSAAYQIPVSVRMQGELDRVALENALNTLVQRHEMLRTVFVSIEGEAWQEIAPEGHFRLTMVDLSGCSVAERDAQLRFHRREEARERFDLRVGPLIRGRLLQIRADEHVLLITAHHIITDGWSVEVMLQELSELYSTYRLGDDKSPRPLPIQYADYAQWQRDWMKGDVLEKQLSYWRARLKGAAPELDLPMAKRRPAIRSYGADTVEINFGAQLSAELRAFALRHDMTLFMVLYAGLTIMLSRVSCQEDVVIGTPIANRQRPELEKLIGLFVNTLVLRVGVRGEALVDEFLRTIKEVTLGAYEHQDLPFEKLVEALQPHRNVGRNPLFRVAFALQNTPKSDLQFAGLTVTLDDPVDDLSMFDLWVSLEERADGIVGSMQYAVELFDRETVERWSECFTVLLRGITDRTHHRVGDLPILSLSEQHQVITLFNATESAFPREKLVHQLFEEQVESRPTAVAVLYEEQSWTYAELNGKANQLAHYLVEQGVQVGECIPVLMPRCVHMLIAQLAVLKCGGVYVPVDPRLPVERQAFMVGDCGARWVLSQEGVAARLADRSIQWVDCAEMLNGIRGYPTDNLSLRSDTPPPAYVMYTSGSTGVPKGVVVPHRAVNRLVINNNYAQLESKDCIAHCSNPAFDASTFEIWGGLLNGARVLIVPQDIILEVTRFSALLQRHNVTVLWLTVGLLAQYAEPLAAVFAQLRYLITGGDVVDPGIIRQIMHRSAPRQLLNAYGPTECTTFSTTYLIETLEQGVADNLPIGRPISNTQVYILDSHLQPVPIGVIGEIFIGGAGVALGYLNRPALTAERFIADPFSSDPSERLYRSGDLGRWRADGNIEFLGRNDHQVKLRGYRIELGEIEAQLMRHAHVKDAAVVLREDIPGEKHLVAYVTTRTQAVPAAEELRVHVQALLPEYMVPSAFVVLERFPLTTNGKLDRAALPAPELGAYVSRKYEEPKGDGEKGLAEIWRDLLGVKRVGRQDDFFELGGHSLLAVKLVLKANQYFGSSLSVTDAYKSRTIQAMAARLLTGRTSNELVNLAKEAMLGDAIFAKAPRSAAIERAVLLTGCTGFVGRFLLERLLLDTDATIYCLVRAGSAQQGMSRLRRTLVNWDLWRDEAERRIVAVPGDLASPRLGLDDNAYKILSEEVGSIYHCGCSMNHLETYAMAKRTNVDSAKELVELATHETTKLINYISTLSVFNLLSDAPRVVREDSSIDYERHFTSGGYAASKWVSDKIFLTANERGVPCNVFRLGLVWADSQQGRYDALQREYRVIKSCLLSGCGIKNYTYQMAPTPVDFVARAVVFLGTRHSDGNGIFHISSTDQKISGVFERCNEIAGTSLSLVSSDEWISEIRRRHRAGHSLPAVPILDVMSLMGEDPDREYNIDSKFTRFTSDRTNRELEDAGIDVPVFDDDLLRVCLDRFFVRDADVQASLNGNGRQSADAANA
ncbi:MAG: amino acid adenylation domain-containing protein [Steroidobacteraceae bacterium]